jgi:hypothetical protein
MDNETENTEVTTAAPKERRKWRFAADTRILTMLEPNGSSSAFPFSSLPAASLDYATQLGLVHILSRADNAELAFGKLEAGDFPQPGEPKAPALPGWRQAIAAALVDATKKHDLPLSQDAAQAKAAALDTVAVNGMKTDPAVIKFYHKLRGTAPVGVASLLAVAA